MSRQGITRARVVAAVSAAAVLACLVSTVPAGAAGSVQLDEARARVKELANRISAGEARVTSLKNQLNDLSAQFGHEVVKLEGIRTELSNTGTKLVATKHHLDELRTLMRNRARAVYMHGPTQIIDLVLGARTFAEFTGRIIYAATIAREDAVLVGQVRTAKATLNDQLTAQAILEGDQTRQVDIVSAEQRAVSSTFAAQLATVSELAAERIEAAKLVTQLESQLGNELAGLKRVAGQGMTISYGSWATDFLSALGAESSRNNMIAIVAWEAAEGTQATWNPLATTYPMPGATAYNDYGVRNFTSKEQGLEASILTLKRSGHGYEAIVARLRANADPMDTAKAINASDWCRGCAGGYYVVGFIPAVEQYYDKYAG